MDLNGIAESFPEVGEAFQNVCAVCQTPSKKSCSICHKVFYCSTEHQKSHWKDVHKFECGGALIRVNSSTKLGPIFVATQDIPAGTLILTELPVLVTPHVIHEVEGHKEDLPVPDYTAFGITSCITCRTILKPDQIDSSPACSKCDIFPFCSPTCALDKKHLDGECFVLNRCGGPMRKEILTNPRHLTYLRYLHLDDETKAKILDIIEEDTWSKFTPISVLDLKPDYCVDKQFIQFILPRYATNPKLKMSPDQYASSLAPLMKKKCECKQTDSIFSPIPDDEGINNDGLEKEFGEFLIEEHYSGTRRNSFVRDLVKLKQVLGLKTITVPLAFNRDISGGYGKTELLFLKASNFVQNCFPNCATIISRGPKFQLKVKTTVDVKKGGILTINYKQQHIYFGTQVDFRLRFIEKGISCICPKCTDPTGTELGTMLSGIKCKDCKEGYLLPANPRDLAMDTPWRCNGVGCKGKGSTFKELEKYLESLLEKVQAFLNAPRDQVDLDMFNKFFDTLRSKLHPNHWFLFQTQKGWVDKTSAALEKGVAFSTPRIQLHISMILELLRMAEIVAPGLSWIKGDLLRLLSIGLTKRLEGIISGAARKPLLERLINVIDSLLPIIKLYPHDWPLDKVKGFQVQREKLQMELDKY